jgi:hypothetical protein
MFVTDAVLQSYSPQFFSPQIQVAHVSSFSLPGADRNVTGDSSPRNPSGYGHPPNAGVAPISPRLPLQHSQHHQYLQYSAGSYPTHQFPSGFSNSYGNISQNVSPLPRFRRQRSKSDISKENPPPHKANQHTLGSPRNSETSGAGANSPRDSVESTSKPKSPRWQQEQYSNSKKAQSQSDRRRTKSLGGKMGQINGNSGHSNQKSSSLEVTEHKAKRRPSPSNQGNISVNSFDMERRDSFGSSDSNSPGELDSPSELGEELLFEIETDLQPQKGQNYERTYDPVFNQYVPSYDVYNKFGSMHLGPQLGHNSGRANSNVHQPMWTGLPNSYPPPSYSSNMSGNILLELNSFAPGFTPPSYNPPNNFQHLRSGTKGWQIT